MGICRTCRNEKDMSEFYKTNGKLMTQCKTCWSEYVSERRRIKGLEGLSDNRYDPFAKTLLAARKNANLTQEELGSMINVTGTQIRLWEKSKRYPRPTARKALTTVLNMKLPMAAVQSHDGRIPYEILNCVVCKKPFPVYKRNVKCCSRKCSGKLLGDSQLGELNQGWKGGISHSNGYVKELSKGHPMADGRGYILQHRLVMENVIGRYLKPNEHVHHKNGIRNDNRPENLELWTNGRKDPPGIRIIDWVVDYLKNQGWHIKPNE